MKESRCKQFSLTPSQNDCCFITIDGGTRAMYAEKALQIVQRELERSHVSNEILDTITWSRNYSWCCLHNCYGHNTEDCRSYDYKRVKY